MSPPTLTSDLVLRSVRRRSGNPRGGRVRVRWYQILSHTGVLRLSLSASAASGGDYGAREYSGSWTLTLFAADGLHPLMADLDGPVVLFDGVCNLCSWAVRFIVSHDDGSLRFAPLQSEVASELLGTTGLQTDYFDSLVYVNDGNAYTKSAGAVRIARHLDVPYRWAWHLRLLPQSLLNVAYDGLATVRYQVFGRKDTCMVPDDELRKRFLDTA